jgi:hypothetical protein
VAAANCAGQGAFGLTEAVATALAPPGPPCSVELEGLPAGGQGAAPEQLVLRWAAPRPAPAAAAPVSYEVVAAPMPAALAPWSAEAAAGAAGAAPEVREREKAWEKAAASGGAVKATVSARGAAECRLDRLLPGGCYAVRLRAVGAEGAGHSAWSAEAWVATAARAEVESGAGSDAAAAGSAIVLAAAANGGGKKGKKGSARAGSSTSLAPEAGEEHAASQGGAPASAARAVAAKRTGKVAAAVASAQAQARGPPVKRTPLTRLQAFLRAKMWRIVLIAVLVALITYMATQAH